MKSKKSSYFLEIDDSSGQSNGKASTESPELAKTEAKPVAAKAQPKAKTPEAPKAKKAEAPKAPAPAPSQPAKPQPAPQPKQRKEFATRYLMSDTPTPRRRPGANMKSFLDMAKDPGLRR
ncbi:hypothetical protein NEA10_06000 [Phormidium yuhuli AB48]|uniref:Uncharacterized protein n=1 Tax=Phormidium yuhuli AB48 TaxID=2940671 RepID=A0ABY5ATU4_9CYAN|nr:hypothetical protein [Phormidium yuhuli]USR92273.1 hypothetical protein NEA10_06000 [Phormidium yuhuli AB48]